MSANKRIEKVYPLSPMQEGMFYHSRRDEDSAAYFEQKIFTVKGELDDELLQRSFEQIFQRYEILRTVFRSDKLERPNQFVLKHRKFQLNVEDITRLTDEQQTVVREEVAAKDRERGFDVTRDILMRVTLIKKSPGEHELVWSFHHIIMDGWCLGIIYSELLQIYRCLKTGEPVQLPPVKPYHNYIKWLEQQDKNKAAMFWQDYLNDYRQQVGLPRLKSSAYRPNEPQRAPSYRLEEYDHLLEPRYVTALNIAASTHRVTLNSVFQAMWGLLLQRYNNGSDVVYGQVVSGRPPEVDGVETMVGLFINTVPIRVKTEPGDSFGGMVRRIQAESITATQYDYLSLADIQAKSSLKGQLIDHLVAFENLPLHRQIQDTGPGAAGESMAQQFQVREDRQYNQTNYDLNIIVIPFEPFVIRFNYNAHHYENDFIRQVAQHLTRIAGQVLENPGITVKEIELITAEEKRRIMEEYNRTDAAWPREKTLHALFDDQVQRIPDAIAVTNVPGVGTRFIASTPTATASSTTSSTTPETVTYKELKEKSDRMALYLQSKGVTPDSVVALKMEPSCEMITAILGILKAGGAYLPIDPQLPGERIDYMLQDSSASILVTASLLETALQTPSAPLTPGVKSTNVTNNITNNNINNYTNNNVNNAAYIIYTSGTTGKPKGVVIEHRNVVRLMTNDQFRFDFSDGDVWTMFHSYSFDFSVWEMYGALLYGGKLVMVPKMMARDTARFREILKEHGVTVLNQTPSAFYQLSAHEMKENRKDLNLRYIIFGGEALSPGKLKEWKARYPQTKLINMYGITETTVHVTFKEITGYDIDSGVSNIGTPIPTLTAYILDRSAHLQPVGAAGELCVGGEGVGRGYLNRPELTAERFVNYKFQVTNDGKIAGSNSQMTDGSSFLLYKSGDLARWLPGGEMEYLGRIDHQVKIRGYRIELGEIESRLAGHEAVREAVVVDRTGDNGDRYLCAYVVSGEKRPTAHHLREYLLRMLPDYMVPSFFIWLERIPLTANGKLDRHALPEPGITAGEGYVAPRNEVEETLVEIWSGVLGVAKEEIGIDDNFFELGGHSLKATIIISKIHKRMDVNIPLAEVFLKPTIREMAQAVAGGEEKRHHAVEPVETKEYYPLSPAQKRLYLIYTMDRDSTAYNSTAAFRVAGNIDEQKLEDTFTKLIRRHESFRTSFHMVNGEPAQKIHQDIQFKIDRHTISTDATAHPIKSFTGVQGAVFQKSPLGGCSSMVLAGGITGVLYPFKLSEAPLLRVAVLTESGGDTVLVVDMHHIITDGTSMGIVLRDFMELYRGNRLAEPRLRYSDYACWRQRLAESGELERQEKYWLERFSGEIPVLDIPVDKPRPAVREFVGDSVTFGIGEWETRRLKLMALDEGVTLFMVLTAVLKVFLARVTGQQQIVVGTPVAGRRHADLEEIVGMFVNTLPLMSRPGDEKTFRAYLEEVGTGTLEAFENQEYPFEALVEKVVKARDTARNPLFDVMMALQNMEIEPVGDTGLRLIPYPLDRGTAIFDMTFQGVEVGKEIHFSIEYCTALYNKETVERFARFYKRVVEITTENRNLRIADIQLFTDEERARILYDFNDTTVEFPGDKTVVHLFEEQVERLPDSLAVMGQGMVPAERNENMAHLPLEVSITYRELNRRSLTLARHLIRNGVTAETIVAIKIERSIEMIVAIFGVLKAGGAYLPISPEFPQERIDYMLKDSRAKVVLTAFDVTALVKNELKNDQKNDCSGELSETSALPMTPGAPVAGTTNIAYIIYTSGTTGRPKGVLTEHRGIYNTIRWRKGEFKLGPEDRVLQLFAASFDGFIGSFFTAVTSGAGSELLTEEQIRDVYCIREMIKVRGITHFVCVPALYASLLEIGVPGDFDGMKSVGTGGDVLTPALVEKSKRLFPRLTITNEYGPTESSVMCTFYPDVQPEPTIPIGKPLTNVKLYIMDRHHRVVPVGIAGELHVGGAGLARGYLNNPKLTAERFVNYKLQITNHKQFTYSNCQLQNKENEDYIILYKTLYKTGDLARWRPDGNIEFLGRIDHQVKIRGFRIELGEIENRLLNHEHIAETVVTNRKDPDGDTYLCAYYVVAGNEDRVLTVPHLREFLSAHLPAYMVPSYFVQLTEMPLNCSGKINRSALPEPDTSDIKLEGQYVAPVDRMETLIADTWSDVLNLEQIGTADNFFDLGGNSLKILQVHQKLTTALDRKIPVVDLFKYSTVAGLARYLGGADSISKPGKARAEDAGEKFPGTGDIAVIGMAGRFPGAANIAEFWENLVQGRESIRFFSVQELEQEGIDARQLEDPYYVRARGVVDEKERFDAAFFNYTPREAHIMDPQIRVFHETVWAALEDAGYNPENNEDSIGLYAGASGSIGWRVRVHLHGDDHRANFFEDHQLVEEHFLASRISYKLNLKGPAMYMHTACSTSLTAIHTARNALLAGDCAMALAGGVSLSAERKIGYHYREGMVMSPDGHCRAFDASAGGTVGGEGAAAVLLKPLQQALRDGDNIYAVMKSSAANNDGSRKVGFSAPSIDGQAEAIGEALRSAGVPPESISYIETHGTATVLGDPIEMEALDQAFRTGNKSYCAIGSVKTNVGHLDSAAGVTGFIKAVLALRHKIIPQSLHFEIPNPNIDLTNSPFYVNTRTSQWEPGEYPRRAGVSSFGIGGTNVHIILEESPQNQERPADSEAQLILLSAATETALETMKTNLAEYLRARPAVDIRDVAYTLQVGRKMFLHRWTAVCKTTEELVEILTTNPAVEKTPLKDDASGQALLRVGNQWLQGREQDWTEFNRGKDRRRVPLPTYPFEGEKYWIENKPLNLQALQHTSALNASTGPVKKDDISQWFYVPRWERSTAIPSLHDSKSGKDSKSGEKPVMVMYHSGSLQMDYVEELLRSRYRLITVKRGDEYKETGEDEFIMAPGNPGHYERLYNRLFQLKRFPDRIFHTWNTTELNPGTEHAHHSLDSAKLYRSIFSLTYTAAAIGKQAFGGDVDMDVLTVNSQDVVGTESLEPENALVQGPLKVISQEYPYLRCRSIDIERTGTVSGSPQEKAQAVQLAAELMADSSSFAGDIALRGRYRWIKNYEPLRLEPAETEPVQLRERGVYLLTGGWGKIGIAFSRYLVKHYKARLILTGVTPVPPRQEWEQWLQEHGEDHPVTRKIKTLRRLEADGGEILALTADAGDKDAMEKVIQRAEEVFGTINGVIHAAGVTGGNSVLCPVEAVGEVEFRRQFRPKIHGTRNLAQLFRERPPDFFILTSSLSQILGGLGFTAYSAANAYMDAFAHHMNTTGIEQTFPQGINGVPRGAAPWPSESRRRQSGCSSMLPAGGMKAKWLSVNWADWSFHAGERKTGSNMGASAVEMMITPQEGVETLKRVLSLLDAPVSQVAISAGDMQARIRQWVELRSLQAESTGKTASELQSDDMSHTDRSNPRPPLSMPYEAPVSRVEQAVAAVWQNQFGYREIGRNDDFFELGGDSLKAITMISKLHKELNARVKLNDFFANPTVGTLAQYIGGVETGDFAAVRPVEERQYYPLSAAQKRLYLLDRMETLGTSYNLTMTMRLEGPLDQDRLEQTFRELIKRHDSFRTSFQMQDDEPVQRIHEYETLEFEIEKIGEREERGNRQQATGKREGRGNREESTEIKPHNEKREEPGPWCSDAIYRVSPTAKDEVRRFIRKFDLSKAPLLRVGLKKEENEQYNEQCNERHILIVDMHHIIFDGVSQQILFREFAMLYGQQTLPPMKLQYKDYAAWQNSAERREALERQEKYWLNRLGGEQPVPELPFDYPRPVVRSFEGAVVESALTAEETTGLNNLARSEGATLFMTLQAVFTILLAKLGGCETIQVGTPIAGRSHADLEPIIGMFVNTLVLRNNPSPDQSFREYLRKVKQTTLEAFENQDYQFEDLVEHVARERDTSRNPVFDVMLVLQNIMETRTPSPASAPVPPQGGLTVNPLPMDKTTAQFDLMLEAGEQGDRLYYSLQYGTRLFRQETVQRFIGYFEKLIDGVIANPSVTISEIEIISEEEKTKLLEEFNTVPVSGDYQLDKPLHRLFSEQTARTPELMAVNADGQSMDYRELENRSNRLADTLRQHGATAGTVVVLQLQRSIEMIVAILGILKTGSGYLPIDPNYPKERIEYMINDSAARIILKKTGTRNSNGQNGRQLPMVLDYEQLDYEQLDYERLEYEFVSSPGDRTSALSPSALAYILYTSGSTGRPKGVMVEHRAVVNMVAYHRQVFEEGPGTRMSQVASPSFDAMGFEIWPALLSGASLYIVPEELRLDVRGLIEWLGRNRIEIAFLPTAIGEQVLNEEWIEDDTALRYLRLGGDRLTRWPAPTLPFEVYNIYGPSEDTICSTWAHVEPGGLPGTCPHIGRPVANHRIYILGSDWRVKPTGVAGELLIAGIGLARGYLNNPKLTAERFVNVKLQMTNTEKQEQLKLYRTGDLARWRWDGNIEFLGRIDHQVKIRGFRIEPGEIENRLRNHDAVTDTAVVVRDDAAGDKYLCAYVVSSNQEHEALREYLSRWLPDYMIPSRFVDMERIPLTPNGKVDRRALPEPGVGEGSPEVAFIAPRNEIERNLAKIWQEVLGLSEIPGIDGNFFHLGGQSLKAAVLVSRIQKVLKVKIPMTEMFRQPTIRKLALLVGGREQECFGEIEPMEEKDYYKCSPAQKRMYILQQMEIDSTVYNMPQVLPFKRMDDIGKEKLEQVVRKLIARHESLRTGFHMMKGEPVQRIHRNVEFVVEEIGNSEEIGKRQKAIGNSERTREPGSGGGDGSYCVNPSIATKVMHFIRPFDLSCAPLLRVGFVENGNAVMLVTDMHHIISDGVSMGLLTEDFMAMYRDDVLPALRIQYKDYSEWRYREEQQTILERQQEYWLKQFETGIPQAEIPIDKPRPAVQQFDGRRERLILTNEETEGVKRCTGKDGVTLYMVLMGAMNLLISRLSGSEDVVVGTAVAGRGHADLEPVIGMFVNTLALRNRIEPSHSVTQFLQTVKTSTLRAFENQDYPFEELVEKLNVKRDSGRNPLFDVMFTLQNVAENTEPVPLSGEGSENENPAMEINPVAKFDLTVMAHEYGNGLLLNFEYAEALFESATIKRFARYYRQILEEFTAHPENLLADIELIPPEERQQILLEFNRSQRQYDRDKTVHHCFEEQSHRTPDAVALEGVSGVGTRFIASAPRVAVTYDELNKRAHRLGSYLQTQGVQPESIVAVKMERSVEYAVAILAILKTGGAYLPIDPDYPQERIEYMLKDSQAVMMMENTEAGNAKFDRCASNSISPHSLCYIMYTSGSTGRPKGTMVEHQNVTRLVRNADYVELNQETRILQTGAPVFDAATFEVWGALLNGGRVYLEQREIILDSRKFTRHLVRNRINVMFLSTALFNQQVQQNIDFLLPLKWLLVGGETASPMHFNRARLRNKNLNLIHCYGPTENTTFTTTYPVSRDYRHTVPIGGPIGNTTVYILDKMQRVQPIGIAGEIYTGGDGVARGYLNNPELTAERFVNYKLQITNHKQFTNSNGQLQNKENENYIILYKTLYKTGDLARWLPDGSIEFLGRVDHQVKIRGFRIEPAEIEKQLLQLEDVAETVVVDRLDARGEKYLCAYFVHRNKPDISQIRRKLAERLPDYMIPAVFVDVEQFVLNVNGKIDRHALPEPEFKSTAPSTDTLPRNPVEKKLAEIWADVLAIDMTKGKTKTDIGIDADFFQLGGHSLKATVMIDRVHKALGTRVPLAELFSAPTIRAMAEKIKSGACLLHSEIPPAEKKEFYPLSPAQKRLFLLNRMEPDGTGYNMPMAFMLDADVDVPALEAAFKRLINRHQSFRTSFHIIDGEPYQRIHETVTFGIEKMEIGKRQQAIGKSGEMGNRGVDDCIGEFVRAFDLTGAPLMRAGVIENVEKVETGNGKKILVVDMHHIISDGESMDILFRELAQPGDSLPLLRLQYTDYSQWLRQPDVRDRIREQENYWLTQLAGEIPELNLPLDNPRPPVYSFDGGRLSAAVGGSETEMLKRQAAHYGVTPFMVILSLYNILLSKLSNSEDIIVGTVVAARRHADLQHIVGMFVNTLALRSRPEGEKTFESFLLEVKENTLQAFDNQEYPFEELVEKVKLPRNTGRNPLFDVMFSHRQADNKSDSTVQRQSTIKPYPFESGVAKFDLTLSASEENGGLLLSLEYGVHLFKPETIDRFLDYLTRIIGEVLRNPVIKIADIDMLPPEEKDELLHNFNRTDAAYPREKTIHGLFEEQVRRYPDHIAVSAEQEITYRRLNAASNRLAARLQRDGVTAGSIVALKLDRSIQMITAILATLKAGAAYLPIEPELPAQRIDYMLKDSAAITVLTPSEPANSQNDGDGSDESYKTPMPPVSGNSDVAYIIYTSGTTGKPKGVMIEHRNVVRLMTNEKFQFDFNASDVWTMFHSYSFDFSVWEMYGALLYGGKLVMVPKIAAMDTAQFRSMLKEHGVTVLNQTPSSFYRLNEYEMNASGKDLKLRYVIFGGEALNPSKLNQWNTRYPETRLINMYGITETTVHVTFKEITGQEIETGISNIGRPIPTLKTYIVDRHQKLLPLGVAGELAVAGEGVGRGYLNRPELTAERFVNDKFQITNDKQNPNSNSQITNGSSSLLYKSGDLARMLPNGEMEYLGRIDHQVKIRGFRIESGEIENRLQKLEAVADAVVVVNQHSNGEKFLCAYIVPAPGNEDTGPETYRSGLSGYLPEYMVPAVYVSLDEIPLTANGKVDRSALPAPEITGSGETAAQTPRTHIEKQLVKIYEDILRVKNIGVRDDFFQLGGNSLQVVKLTAAIHDAFGIEISILQVFRSPTIEALAAELVTNQWASGADQVVIPLNPGKEKKIFAFPPALPYGLAYAELAKLLEHYTIYAFNYVEQKNSGEDRMEIYLETLLELQPEGPYTLLGYSAGAKLCVKAAGMLNARGHNVSDIVILDGYSRGSGEDDENTETAEFYRMVEQGIETLGAHHIKQQILDALEDYLQYHNNLQIDETNNAHIHLIQAEDKKGLDGFIGWKEYTENREILYQGNGNHPEMLSPGFIEKNAALILQLLENNE